MNKCEICNLKIFEDSEIKAWVEIKGKYYHNDCIEYAVEGNNKWRKIRSSFSQIEWGSTTTLCVICDLWQCGKCKRYTGGYLSTNCKECNAHFRSTGGRCIRSNEEE